MSTSYPYFIPLRYENERVVCPSKLRGELFTTGAVDNIDHNTSSTTSQSSFHGTAISLVQHPSNSTSRTPREVDTFDPNKTSTSKTISHLPSSYREVPPLAMPNRNMNAPPVPAPLLTSSTPLCASSFDEKDWLEKTQELVVKEKLDAKNYVS